MHNSVSHMDRIEALRCLLATPRLDFATTVVMLDAVPMLADSIAEAVRTARGAVTAAPAGDQRHEAVARYALARVVLALEREAGIV